MIVQDLWRTIGSGKVWKDDIKNREKDGSHYWVHTTIVPFLDENGEPYQYLAIRNEVTRLKQVEKDLQQLMMDVMQIQEEERRRFSRELHDGMSAVPKYKRINPQNHYESGIGGLFFDRYYFHCFA
jgi:two-component system sensor histidine kinase NreB